MTVYYATKYNCGVFCCAVMRALLVLVLGFYLYFIYQVILVESKEAQSKHRHDYG